MRGAAAGLLALVAALPVSGCGNRTRKLDETRFYDGPQFRLKLVRYHENLPFHYMGEVFRVHCASARTADSLAQETQEAGWVTLGSGGAIGSKSAVLAR